MKLSTKGRYGLRAIFEVALKQENGPVSLSSIAQSQELSIRYLEQLFSKMKKAGIVKSIRGANGGYILAKNPKDITVGDIIRLFEGNVTPSECVEDTLCDHADLCVTRDVWIKIKRSIDCVLDGTTLEDMVTDYKNRLSMYSQKRYDFKYKIF